jgi:hypothetical protein
MLAEDKFAHDTFNLPKAYEGKNKYLERVIDYLITNDNDFYTSQLLPFVQTDDLSIKWEIFRFNKTLMDLEPHQGVPRYVTSEREARSDRLVRRGLAFIIEHGFYTTDQGRQHYLMNLRQIVDSVNETCEHGVIYALLSADNHYREWRRQHGSSVHRPQDLQRHAKRLWGCVQKQERGLYLLDAELKDEMRYEGVKPDTWLLPSKMSIYVTMVPSAEVEYYRKGAGASANLEKGPDNLLSFRGSNVYESRPFDIDFMKTPYDLLVRRRQIGEHFIMRDPKKAGDEATDEEAATADIMIYSMNSDKFERISYKDVATAATGIEAADDDANGYVLFRPFETYDMASAVLMKKGLETGMTAHGHHDFMLSDDTIHKIHIGHYTFYHKSIVKQPKNITICEDIFARNYIRGEGVSLYSKADWEEDRANDYFSKDIIAIRTNVDKVQNPCDITGQYENQVLDASPTDLSGSQVTDLYGAKSLKIARDLGLDKLKYFNEDPNKFLSPLRSVNTMTWQGMQVEQKDGKFDQITLATGHWGTNVYAGCKSVRTGANAFLKDMGYEKIRSEQAFK